MYSTYDQWKLRTPPEYERGDPPEWACRDCAGDGKELPCWANNYCRTSVCERCGGTGEDPDYAEEEQEELDEGQIVAVNVIETPDMEPVF